MTDAFVAVSQITIDSAETETLVDAFNARLGEVDAWPGFRHLEVWQSEHDETQFVMVSWWDDKQCFQAYMQSDAHRRSHDRIPDEPARPRPAGFKRYRVVAR